MFKSNCNKQLIINVKLPIVFTESGDLAQWDHGPWE